MLRELELETSLSFSTIFSLLIFGIFLSIFQCKVNNTELEITRHIQMCCHFTKTVDGGASGDLQKATLWVQQPFLLLLSSDNLDWQKNA